MLSSQDKQVARIPPLLVVLGWLAGCATPPPPVPPHLAHKAAVLPVINRTGDPLAVAGSGLMDRYVTHSEELTVSDILRSEARLQLLQNGFEVASSQTVEAALKGRAPSSTGSAADLAAQGGLGTLCLYLQIRRWEPHV